MMRLCARLLLATQSRSAVTASDGAMDSATDAPSSDVGLDAQDAGADANGTVDAALDAEAMDAPDAATDGETDAG